MNPAEREQAQQAQQEAIRNYESVKKDWEVANKRLSEVAEDLKEANERYVKSLMNES